MKKTAYIIYNELQTPEQWRFFRTRKACKEEIDRVFTPAMKSLGQLKPVKVTLEFDV